MHVWLLCNLNELGMFLTKHILLLSMHKRRLPYTASNSNLHQQELRNLFYLRICFLQSSRCSN